MASEEEKRVLRAEAFEWADFWARSRVKDLAVDEDTILSVLLRYYNAGALTEEELRRALTTAGATYTALGEEETQHPQARIEHAATSADVDEEIAPLILELWRAGLETVSSCQDRHGRVSIDFADATTAEDFLNIVVGERSADVESIYNRIVIDDEPADWEPFRRHRRWLFGGGQAVDYSRSGPPEIGLWCVSVAFPRGDLEEVLRRLLAHNA